MLSRLFVRSFSDSDTKARRSKTFLIESNVNVSIGD